jgi:two-component system, OmpR family, phosphate regulon sensor histidine kinase PhoR
MKNFRFKYYFFIAISILFFFIVSIYLTINLTSVSNIMLKTFLLSILLFLVIVYILNKALQENIDPIKKLSKAMDTFTLDLEENTARFEYDGREEIKNLANSFNKMRNKMIETVSDIKTMSKYKQDFMTNVTHELKTPLTSILGYLETLELGAIDDKEHSHTFLKTIKRNVLRLSELVDDILNLAKIENKASNKKNIDLIKVFEMVAKDYNLYNKNNVIIDIKEKNIKFLADTEEIYSAFSNYISNALKYSNSKNIVIKLFTKNNKIFYSVKDNGQGIEKQHLSRIFERFYRIDKGRSRREGGTGLGLSIVKNIIEKYDGQVGVQSILGKGADFTFEIPLTTTK